MKRFAWVFAMSVLIAPLAGAQSSGVAGPAAPGEPPVTVLFDNGPLVNSPGTGPEVLEILRAYYASLAEQAPP